jgi:anaerobic magnesium-protoporphyrin IX monomethyl ester cyclase
MNIVLISFDVELYCLGIRILSSVLRKRGYSVKCVFLPPTTCKDYKQNKFKSVYTSGVLNNLKSLCSDADLIGMSLLTNQFIQAQTITEFLKTNGIKTPIIWGGIQASVEPEVCLEYADIVCQGEGEDALSELCESIELGTNNNRIRNLWFNSEDGVIRNPLRPLKQDLDSVPLPDYSCVDHFVAKADSIERLTLNEFLNYSGERFMGNGKSIMYPIMTSRGCPFSCTYCCNAVLRRLYPGEKLLRWRSVENVIAEIKMIQDNVGKIDELVIVDDNFTAQSQSELIKFFENYNKHIRIPFFCQVSPLTITQEKMDLLFSSGCLRVTMGVETGHENVAAMYGRQRFHSVLLDSIALVEKYRPAMKYPPTYQFIVDNPFETVEEALTTLRLAVNLPKPWDNPMFSLMLFPGTALYERAVKEGLVKDKYTQIYGRNWHEQSKPFFQFWIRLYRANFPRPFLKFLLQRWIVRILANKFANFIWKTPCFSWLLKNSR